MAEHPKLRTRGLRLRTARGEKFRSARAAALAFGVPISTYGAHERAEAPGGRDFGPEEAAYYARLLNVTAEWLLTGLRSFGNETLASTVITELDGYTAPTGGEFFAAAPGRRPRVDIPPLITEATHGLVITGDVLGSLFAGWLLVYDDLRQPVAPELIGHLCVVGLGAERMLVRRVLQGANPGRYKLLSWRPPDLDDVEVEWAAPIKALIQPDPDI